MTNVLGCADAYTARIHFRGGQREWLSLGFGLAQVTWDRRMNDTSEAQVVIAKAGVDPTCVEKLVQTEPWVHELTLYRGMGREGPLIWQGPIRRVEETRTAFIIDARDITAWLDRRTNKFAYNYQNAYVSEICDRLITYAMRVDDPNMLPYLRIDHVGVRATREQDKADAVIVGDEIDSLTALGMEFTCVGRRMWISPRVTLRHRAQGRLTDFDILEEISVVQDGDMNVTRWVINGDGVSGRSGGGSPFFGLLEQIGSSESIRSADCVTEARQRLAWSRNPPQIVTVPEGARLAPSAPITIERLVPGRRIDVALTSAEFASGTGRGAVTAMALSQVGGNWEPGTGEQVTVSLTPIGALVEQAAQGLWLLPDLPNPELGDPLARTGGDSGG